MFTFKQFRIKQDKTPMKVGTDGVLLGAWVRSFTSDETILDIGTGTGLIALMMAQRNAFAHIDAVEIDESSAEQAKENVDESVWAERIGIHCVNICDFNNKIKYDLIVSNPPFFNDSLLPPDARRGQARHTTTLNFKELVASVAHLLSESGRFALILPLNEMQLFKNETEGTLSLVRECQVLGRKGGDIKRVMCEFARESHSHCMAETLAIRESVGNEYTQEYKELTADFYLKF